ncbi:Diphthine methyl ester synthase [Aduncisulcus paluster]|uniref:diphthine methyl ester synthase n=1 Tax=Aduncisulcus paluster TaxID=2918883 RepID=A0ABQ5L1P7_9EUKA|nr:Diphthine methyl ester synthase [Aduncisulcus paluster]|eukprot:gnl/Carplike_NY0171/2752_a3701_501.p1 GENE.gnl/Carplike_NY0171/2752_a3701_501~~gnl/Carplike_NY0171/2752_a3701_501.p1  ORF type:complete len:285 (+),score=59.82 gnl/Carplike_NY0171/2752_a3701_501:30-884(+)
MLYLIGLGLGDEKSITLKGLEIVKKCDKVFVENYTSILKNLDEMIPMLEKFFERSVEAADRDTVESRAELILDGAKDRDVAVLIVGDPFCATTHTDLFLRARKKGINVSVIHNASIINAIGSTGLEVYRFGHVVSIVFFDEGWKPSSFYKRIKENKSRGLHTLCLLDIKTRERTIEAMMKGLDIFQPPRFMTVDVAASQLLELEETLKEEVCTSDTLAVAACRVGTESQEFFTGTLGEIAKKSMGEPLHSLVIPGELEPLEAEMLSLWASDEEVISRLKALYEK